MTPVKRIRGLRALVEDAVEHGSRAIERVHLETASRPFAILESIPGIALPARVVHVAHDMSVLASYGMVRVVNRVVGKVVDVALEAAEAEEDDAP